MNPRSSFSRIVHVVTFLGVTALREIRNLDGSVAWFTTRFLLTFIGGVAFVAFICTLKTLFLVLFSAFSLFAWIAVYNFFYHLKQRRKS